MEENGTGEEPQETNKKVEDKKISNNISPLDYINIYSENSVSIFEENPIENNNIDQDVINNPEQITPYDNKQNNNNQNIVTQPEPKKPGRVRSLYLWIKEYCFRPFINSFQSQIATELVFIGLSTFYVLPIWKHLPHTFSYVPCQLQPSKPLNQTIVDNNNNNKELPWWKRLLKPSHLFIIALSGITLVIILSSHDSPPPFNHNHNHHYRHSNYNSDLNKQSLYLKKRNKKAKTNMNSLFYDVNDINNINFDGTYSSFIIKSQSNDNGSDAHNNNTNSDKNDNHDDNHSDVNNNANNENGDNNNENDDNNNDNDNDNDNDDNDGTDNDKNNDNKEKKQQ